MWKPLAQSFDWLLSRTLARWVRPRGEVPRPAAVADDPDEVAWLDTVNVEFLPVGQPLAKLAESDSEAFQEFAFASPVASCWRENQTVRGLAMGPPDADRAVILLHGAYEDNYRHSVWMARCFTRHGYRVYIPEGPCHHRRTPPGVFSGSPMFWSSELVVASMHQWLAETRGLMGYLRRRGMGQIGLYGYSLGSLVGGLAATLWDDFDFLAMLSPVGSHVDAIEQSPIAVRIWPWMKNLPAEERALLNRWAAVHRPPRIEPMQFFITRHDRLQPRELQEAWWQSWGRPPRRDYPHAHLSVHFAKTFYDDLAAFAAEQALVRPTPAVKRLG